MINSCTCVRGALVTCFLNPRSQAVFIMKLSIVSLVLLLGLLLHSATVCSAFDCFPDASALKIAVQGIPANSDGVGYIPIVGNYGPIEAWCFDDAVTDMSQLFQRKRLFNEDISGWDVSKVTNMFAMFQFSEAFNADISGWDVSQVRSMQTTFSSAELFNADIGGWDVSKVTSMRAMVICSSVQCRQ